MLQELLEYHTSKELEEEQILFFYYTGPKELLKKYRPDLDFPDAIGAEIEAEFPSEDLVAEFGYVYIAPIYKKNQDISTLEWHDAGFSYEEIEELLIIAEV